MKTFTLHEANRLIPQVRQGLQEVAEVLERLRHVRDQLMDLRIVWGDQVEDASCADHGEYVAFRDQFTALEAQLRQRMERVTDLGCEVKDPDVGLVDFYADRGGRVVFLCWRKGEDDIRYWHTLEDGFAGRRPITQF
jgi:hypothetical protein